MLVRPTILTFKVLLGQVFLWPLIVSIVYDSVQRIIQRKNQYHGQKWDYFLSSIFSAVINRWSYDLILFLSRLT